MRTIIVSTPTTVSSDVSSWLKVCWRLWAMLSMSLVTLLSRSRVAAVDVAQWERVELGLDVCPQPEHRSLDDAGEQVRLQVGAAPDVA